MVIQERIERLLPYVVESLPDLACRYGKAETFEEVREALARVIPFGLDDTFHECDGRGYMVAPRTPMRSDKPCKACNGRGHSFSDGDMPLDLFLPDEIAREELSTTVAVWRRLGR